MKRFLAKAGGAKGQDALTPYPLESYSAYSEQQQQQQQQPSSPPQNRQYSSLPSHHSYPSYLEDHSEPAHQRPSLSISDSRHKASATPTWAARLKKQTHSDRQDGSSDQQQQQQQWYPQQWQYPQSRSDSQSYSPSQSGGEDRSTQPPHTGYRPMSGGYDSYGQESYRAGNRDSHDLDKYPSNPEELTPQTTSPQQKKSLWSGLGGRVTKGQKAGHEMHTSDSQAPTSVFMDRQDSSQSNRPPEKESKSHWLDLRKNKAMSASAVAKKDPDSIDVVARVTHICQESASAEDRDNMLSLADTIARSEAASKDAAKALRKEFKAGAPETQLRAIRLWSMLMLYGSDRFRFQIANRRFLEVLEDLMEEPRTSLLVREKLIDVWSMFAFLYKKDHDLGSITKSYNKIRPADEPKNGKPLDMTHEMFFHSSAPVGIPLEHSPMSNAASLEPPSSVGQQSSRPSFDGRMTPASQRGGLGLSNLNGDQPPVVRRGSVPDSYASTRVSQEHFHDRHMGPARPTIVQTPIYLQSRDDLNQTRKDELRQVRADCDRARTSADLLIDAVTNAGVRSSEVTDLSARVRQELESLSRRHDLVSTAARQSRQQLVEAREQSYGQQGLSEDPSLMSPDYEVRETPEEQLLEDFLEVTEQFAAAQAIFESAEEEERELEEERRVTELSKVDYRLDRSRFHQDAETGDLHDVQSSTSSSGLLRPPPAPAPSASAVGATAMQTGLSSSSATSAASSSSAAAAVAQARYASHTHQRHPVSDPPRSGPRPLPDPSAAAASAAAAVAANSTSYQPLAQINTQGVPQRHPYTSQSREADDVQSDSSSEIVTPVRPSEKALGKRRAISREDLAAGSYALGSMNISSAGGGMPAPPSSATPMARMDEDHVAALRSSSSNSTWDNRYRDEPDPGSKMPSGLPAQTATPPVLPPLPPQYRAEQEMQRQRQQQQHHHHHQYKDQDHQQHQQHQHQQRPYLGYS